MGSHPVLALLAQDSSTLTDDLLRAVLGGGFIAGLATLIRSLTKRGAQVTGSIERTVLLQERVIERQQRELSAEERAHNKALEDKRLVERERDHLATLVRYYRSRHGDPTDPRMRRLVIDEQGNLEAP